MRRLSACLLLAVLAISPALAQSTSPFNGVSIGAAPGSSGGGGIQFFGSPSAGDITKVYDSTHITTAIPCTNYPSPPVGTSILYGNGSGCFSNVTIGTGLTFVGGTLTATGSGSVTSVGLSAPGIFSVTGSPVTTTGTLTLGLANQNANLVWAGPSTGSPAAPTFRSLVRADMPAGIAYYDTNQVWTASQANTPTALSISGATFTPNFATGQNFQITLVHASCPCTLANPSTTLVPGQTGVFEIIQSASGSDTIGTWGSSYITQGGTAAITLSTGASAKDHFSYFVNLASQIVLSPPLLNAVH